PAPALYSSVSASEETEPFEEGETVATLPPFGYHVAARIFVQPHIIMPFHSESEVERLLAIPIPPLSLVSPTSYPLPPFLMPLPIFTRLPTSSFPLPSSLPSTSGSESIPEAGIPLQKRARFTTPTGGYEVGESYVAAARKIRPALTIADRRRADDRLISRLRRERRYFRTLCTTYAQEVAHSRDYCTHIMDYCQLREVHTSTLVTQMEALRRDALIDQGVAAAMAEAEASRVRNGYGSNGSGPRLAQTVRECTYPAACQVKYAALQGFALTWWNSHVKTITLELAQALPWKTLKKMMTDKYCPRGEIKKLETEMWELKTKGTDVIGYSRRFQELALMCGRTFPEESDRVEKYIGGVPNTIHDSVKATKPKTMHEAIEFATKLMDKRIRDAVENKRKFKGTSGNN
nr:reverse transcriptase domain-containing protein [Tanacetum cinerariifolium]